MSESNGYKRASPTTIRLRVLQAARLRLAGKSLDEVVQYADAEGWDVAWQTVSHYVARADSWLARDIDRQMHHLVRDHIGRRRALFARAEKVGDLATAARLLKDEAELLRLYPAKRHELSGPDGGAMAVQTQELTQDERNQIIISALTRLGWRPPDPGGNGCIDLAGFLSIGSSQDHDRSQDDSGPLAGESTGGLDSF